MAPEMIIPKEWHPEGDYTSHRPMLYHIITMVQDNVTEFGCGLESTPFLADLCNCLGKDFVYYETTAEWFKKVELRLHILGLRNESWIINDYMDIEPVNGILFVDSAPGEQRKDLIKKHAPFAKVIIVHDTQEDIQGVYGIRDALNSFKYRIDLHIEGLPSTTALSNFFDLTKLRGEYGGFWFT